MGVEVSCAASLQQLCQTNASIFQLAIDPTQCIVKGDGVKTAELNQRAEVSLTANRLTNNKPTRRSGNVIGRLKSLCNGSIKTFNVDQLKIGEYYMPYVPTIRGRYELSLSIK